MEDLTLQNLPFGIGCFSKKNDNFPSFLPFQLQFDNATGIIFQKLSDESRNALKLYYSEGGYVSTPLGESEYGKRQGEELLKFITDCANSLNRPIDQLSFLEIGASYGYLLYLLKNLGAKEAVGLEPGNEGVDGSKKYGIQLIKDFFPSKLLTKNFDFIFSYGVLEHIENPKNFVDEMTKQLNDKGIIFIGVPDCEKKMNVGDLSIVAHQHINYFTKNSLMRLMKNCGVSDVKIIDSKERALLIGYGVKSNKNNTSIETDLDDQWVMKNFVINFKKNISSLQELVDNSEKNNKSLGFYAPGQNTIGLLKFKNKPRIFDGDSFKSGKYINGCDSAFEPMKNLLNKPVDVLFICSIDYDQEITNNLLSAGLDSKTEIISLKSIYEKNSNINYNIGSVKKLKKYL